MRSVNLQAPELLIILAVVLLLFGSTKLPKLARSLGQAQKEFKEGTKDELSGEAGAPSREAGTETGAAGGSAATAEESPSGESASGDTS